MPSAPNVSSAWEHLRRTSVLRSRREVFPNCRNNNNQILLRHTSICPQLGHIIFDALNTKSLSVRQQKFMFTVY